MARGATGTADGTAAGAGRAGGVLWQAAVTQAIAASRRATVLTFAEPLRAGGCGHSSHNRCTIIRSTCRGNIRRTVTDGNYTGPRKNASNDLATLEILELGKPVVKE